MCRTDSWEKIGVSNYEVISKVAASEIYAKWKEEFCPSLNLNITKYPWEDISSAAHLSEALEMYGSVDALQYFVMIEPSNADKEIALMAEKPLVIDNHSFDFYVFPKNMAWCMCFTHEDGYLGPVFSKSSNFKTKQKKNIEAVQALTNGYL